MLRADLQEERSAAQREGPAGEGTTLVPLQDSDVVRDGDTYYLVINNLGERCVHSRPYPYISDPPVWPTKVAGCHLLHEDVCPSLAWLSSSIASGPSLVVTNSGLLAIEAPLNC